MRTFKLLSPPIWLLVLVTFSGTLGMHLFVPALPSVTADLGTTSGNAQLTISLYIFGLAVGQLVYGPLADGFGRRPILLIGLSLFTAAGLVAAVAPNIQVLLGARLVQAFGGCAGLLLGRTIIRDTASADLAIKQMAMINMITMLGPGLAPLLGSIIVPTLGWRYVFVLLCALGAVNLACTWKLLPETGSPTRQVSARSISRTYRTLLMSPRFLGFAIGGGTATTSFYAFISAAPFIFTHQLNRPLHEVGLYLALLIVGIATGTFLARRLVGTVSVDGLMTLGSTVLIASSLILLVWATIATPSAPIIGLLMFVYSAGAGLCSPTASMSAISVNVHMTGSAAGLYGFTQMAIGAACAAASAIGSNPMITVSSVLVLTSLLGRGAFMLALKSPPMASC